MKKQLGIFGLSLIPTIIIGAVLTAGAAWLYNQNSKIAKAELERDQAIIQRDQTAVQRDAAISVARENERTIFALESEKKLINESLNTLQQAREEIRTNTVTREIIIERQAGTATSTAVTANVISETIAAVQNDRIRRRGGTTSNGAGPVTNGGAILE